MATPFNVFFENYAPKGALPLMENLEEREDYHASDRNHSTVIQLNVSSSALDGPGGMSHLWVQQASM